MATLVVKSQEMSDNLTIPGVMSNLRRITFGNFVENILTN